MNAIVRVGEVTRRRVDRRWRGGGLIKQRRCPNEPSKRRRTRRRRMRKRRMRKRIRKTGYLGGDKIPIPSVIAPCSAIPLRCFGGPHVPPFPFGCAEFRNDSHGSKRAPIGQSQEGPKRAPPKALRGSQEGPKTAPRRPRAPGSSPRPSPPPPSSLSPSPSLLSLA